MRRLVRLRKADSSMDLQQESTYKVTRSYSLPTTIASPLMLEGWQEFNRQCWGLTPRPLTYNIDSKASLKSIVYLDRGGRARQPRLDHYLPFEFQCAKSTPTAELVRLTSELAEDMIKFGLYRPQAFPPNAVDMRPFVWAGVHVAVRYTILCDLPLTTANKGVKGNIRRAIARGFRCEQTDRFTDVIECLRNTEERQRFTFSLKLDDLILAHRLIGPDVLRTYVCYDPSGAPVCTRIVLATPGHTALDWVCGGYDGAALLLDHVLSDLAANGVSRFDFCGANIPSVADGKSRWGGTLVPYYVVQSWQGASLLHLRDMWQRFRERHRSDRGTSAD